MSQVRDLPVGETSGVALPDVCSGCGVRLALEEEKVCVPGSLGMYPLPDPLPSPAWVTVSGWPARDEPTRVYHPACAPPE